MLISVTKKYLDKSTATHFEFEFFCDCCGSVIKTPVTDFVNGFADEEHLSDTELEARNILYYVDHLNAYERANIEARFELDRCEKCGDMVCQDCAVFADDKGHIFCKNCIAEHN